MSILDSDHDPSSSRNPRSVSGAITHENNWECPISYCQSCAEDPSNEGTLLVIDWLIDLSNIFTLFLSAAAMNDYTVADGVSQNVSVLQHDSTLTSTMPVRLPPMMMVLWSTRASVAEPYQSVVRMAFCSTLVSKVTEKRVWQIPTRLACCAARIPIISLM